MTYGLISKLDDEKSFYILRGKGISEENLIVNFQVYDFITSLTKDDIVYVIDVNRFRNVAQLFMFGRAFMKNGASLYILEQPHLNITPQKPWSDKIIWHFEMILSIERECQFTLTQHLDLDNESGIFLDDSIKLMNLQLLAHTAYTDGIMKHGK